MEKMLRDIPVVVTTYILYPAASRYFDRNDHKNTIESRCPIFTPEQRIAFRTLITYLKIVMKLRAISPSVASSLQQSVYWDKALEDFLEATSTDGKGRVRCRLFSLGYKPCNLCLLRDSIIVAVGTNRRSNDGEIFLSIINWLMRMEQKAILSRDRNTRRWGLNGYMGASMEDLYEVSLSYRHSLEEIVSSNEGTVSRGTPTRFTLGKRDREGKTKEERLPPEDFLLLKIAWNRTMGITTAIENTISNRRKKCLMRKSQETYDKRKKSRTSPTLG